MTHWTNVIPPAKALRCLETIEGGHLWVDPSSTPPETRVFFQSRGGYVAMAWGYQGIAIGCDVFCLEIEEAMPAGPLVVLHDAELLPFADVRLLLRTTWLRPAEPGEVPPGYEPTIEASGRASGVPENALLGGVSVDGVVFLDTQGQPVMTVAAENATTYKVWVATDPVAMQTYLESIDIVPLDELDAFFGSFGAPTDPIY